MVTNFIRRHLKYRRGQRNKKKPKEAFREKLEKRHATLRKRQCVLGKGILLRGEMGFFEGEDFELVDQ